MVLFISFGGEKQIFSSRSCLTGLKMVNCGICIRFIVQWHGRRFSYAQFSQNEINFSNNFLIHGLNELHYIAYRDYLRRSYVRIRAIS